MMGPFAVFSLGWRGRCEHAPIAWRFLGYNGGLLIAASAIGLRLCLEYLGTRPNSFVVFSLAIVLSGWLFGFGPSVVTALVCGLAAMFFLRAQVLTAESLLGLGLYMLTSLGICLIVGEQRSIRLALERTMRELNGAKEHAEKAQEAAERANEAKEQFLHLISHELRNPLQSISMSTHVLRHDLSNPQLTTQRFQRIDLAVQTLSDMIDDLVDSTRIVTGQLRLNYRSMDLAESVRSAIEIMTPVAEGKQIRLVTDIQVDCLPMNGDPDRLQECVCNLVGNAIKFSAKGAGVRICLLHTRLGAEVRVTDQGEGIDPHFLPRVFERFSQAGPSNQRRGGLGLGLSIVKHIVELHQGTIIAESEGDGRGASFTILLPNKLLITQISV
jgi:signal transduction histidine kinase